MSTLCQKRACDSSPETDRKRQHFPPVTFPDVVVVACQQRAEIMHDVANNLVFVSKAVRAELRNAGQSLSLVLARRYTDEYQLSIALTLFLKEWASQVTVFDLSKQRLTVAGGVVHMLQRLPRLEHLTLRFDNGTDGHFAGLANSSFPGMKVLDLRGCRLEPHESTALLRSLSTCRDLKRLHLDYNDLDLPELVEVLGRNTRLTHVSFGGCLRRPDWHIRDVWQALPTSLESFVLGEHSGFEFLDYSFLLGRLEACPQLATLDLENVIKTAEDDHVTRLLRVRLNKLPAVRYLTLNHCQLSREGTYGRITLFETMSIMTSLRKISLDFCNISRVGFIYDLRVLPNLEELSLRGNHISCESTRQFARSWRPEPNKGPFWQRLEVLNLRDNQIDSPYTIVNFMIEVEYMPRMRMIVLARSGHQIHIPEIFQFVLSRNLTATYPGLLPEEVEDKERVLRVTGREVEYLV